MTFPERLETERLLLRWCEATDAEEIFARYASDPEVTRFLSWPTHRTTSDTRTFLEWSLEQRRTGSSFGWLVYPRLGGPLLGSIGCRVQEHLVQFGYCYARDAWGQGYATEAAGAMVRVWLQNPAVWRVQAFCDLENKASARVLEKAGLTLEGTFRRYLTLPSFGDVPRDVLCYARVREP